MLNSKLYTSVNQFCSKPKIVFLILSCIFIFLLYLLLLSEVFSNLLLQCDNNTDIDNSKWNIVSKHPFDPPLIKYTGKENNESFSYTPQITTIIQNANKTDTLIFNMNETQNLKDISCCWSQIFRTMPNKQNPQKNFDSSIRVGNCIHFNNSVVLPKEVENLLVSCSDDKKTNMYKSVHSVLNFEKVSTRFNISEDINKNLDFNRVSKKNEQRKLSILLLGMDGVSRLNLEKYMSRTADYFREKGWLNVKGYNKIGKDTFSNLIAILTGQKRNQCRPTVPYGLDRCPLLWSNYRNAGYVTAYGEDESCCSTFNFQKVGFVVPPTDYYLRPYFLATEKLLKIRKRFEANNNSKTAIKGVTELAVDFAKRFLGLPDFGFFWTNTANHYKFNDLSLLDSQILSTFKQLEKEGVTNDSMIIFLSNMGLRFFRHSFLEDRLPFLYIWLPEWFRQENPEAYQALKVNQNQLISPFDLYETLRDVLIRAGGQAEPSADCPKCRSLLKTMPKIRECKDAGISSHWCTCTSYKNGDASAKSVKEGAYKIVDHMENMIKDYKSNNGSRLCEKLELLKIHRIQTVVDPNNFTSKTYFYMIEVTGGGKFEATIQYYGPGDYSISDDEINRINSYGARGMCLDHGPQWYCVCVK